MPHRYSRFLPGFVWFCDFVILNIALYNPIYNSLTRSIGPSSALIFLLSANVIWLLLYTIFKPYKIFRPFIVKANLYKFVQTVALHIVLLSTTVYFIMGFYINPQQILVSYITFVILIISQRYLLAEFLDHIRKKGYNGRNILIIGDHHITDRLVRHFQNHPEYGYDLVHNSFNGDINNYTIQQLTAKLLDKKPDEIFVCYKQLNEDLINYLVGFGIEYSVKIKVVSDLILTKKYAQVINYYSLPVLQLKADANLGKHIKILKRGFDILFSSTILIVGSPMLLCLYLITKFSSEGPVYYRQERVGLNGKPFQIVKFRSMYVNAEKFGPQLSKDDDPRITKWGKIIRKTRFDELPQFWNVLKGEMSIVGPRPERRYFIEKISDKSPLYKSLLTIKPGITSIGQVHYGYAENVDQMCERMEYDLLYLHNINFNSDLKLIVKTLKVMVQGKGK